MSGEDQGYPCQVRLGEILQERGFTPMTVSRKSGVSYELLRRGLKGTRKMGADEFVKVCLSTGVRLDDFK